LFNPSKSTNFKVLSGYKWNITYVDGKSASGIVGTDIVTVGGTSVSGQAVEIATHVSSSLVSSTFDGLLGLAFSSINTGTTTVLEPCPIKLTSTTMTPKAQQTFFDTAKPSLSSPVFTADLKYHAPGMPHIFFSTLNHGTQSHQALMILGPLIHPSTLAPSPISTWILPTAFGSSLDPDMRLATVLSSHLASMLCMFSSLRKFSQPISYVLYQRRYGNDTYLRS
jgi:hypothetical protein